MADENKGERRFSRVDIIVDTKEEKKDILNFLTVKQLWVIAITAIVLGVVNRNIAQMVSSNINESLGIWAFLLSSIPVIIIAFLVGFYRTKKYEMTYLTYLRKVRPYKKQGRRNLMYFSNVPDWYRKSKRF